MGFSFTNRVPVSSDDEDDEESNSPNELVRCPPHGVRLNDSRLNDSIKDDTSSVPTDLRPSRSVVFKQ